MAGKQGGSIIVRLELLTKGFTNDFDSAANNVVQKSKQMERQLSQLDQKMGNFGKNGAVKNNLDKYFTTPIMDAMRGMNQSLDKWFAQGKGDLSKRISEMTRGVYEEVMNLKNGLKGIPNLDSIMGGFENVEKQITPVSRSVEILRQEFNQLSSAAKLAGQNAAGAFPLETIESPVTMMERMNALNKSVLNAAGSFAATGRSFTAVSSGLHEYNQTFRNAIGLYNDAVTQSKAQAQVQARVTSSMQMQRQQAGLLSQSVGNLTGSFNKYTDSMRLNSNLGNKLYANTYNDYIKSLNKVVDGQDKAAASSRGFEAQSRFLTKTVMGQGSVLDGQINRWANFKHEVENAGTGFRSLTNTMDTFEKSAIASSNMGSNFARNFEGAMAQMQSSSKASIRAIGNNLSMINNATNFSGLTNKFSSAITAMGQSAKAGGKTIAKNLTEGLSATDYMATIFGAMIGQQMWDKAYGKATMLTQLSNRYNPTQANQYLQGYQQYTVKSSTSDEQITNLMKYVTQSGLKSNQTYKALNAMDAAATIADPTQRQELLRNFGMYMTQGYSEALFRGDVTPQEAQLLKSAQTPEQRIQAMETLAKGRGNVDQFGNALSTTTEGPLRGFNSAMAAMDNIMRAMTNAFMGFMNKIAPLFLWFNNLSQGTQNAIGTFVLLSGTLLVGASVIGIFLNLMEPFVAVVRSMIAPLVQMALGLSANTIEETGLTAAITGHIFAMEGETTAAAADRVAHDGVVVSLMAKRMGTTAASVSEMGYKNAILGTIFGLEGETVANYGASTALVAKITGTEGATVAETGRLGALAAMIFGLEAEEVAEFGALTSIVAKTTGTEAATIANAGYGTSLALLTGELTLSSAASMLAAGAMGVLNVIMDANPIILVGLAIAGIVLVIYELGSAMGWWTSIGDMFGKAWGAITSGLHTAWNALVGFFNWIKGGIMDSFFKGGQWQGLIPGLQNLFGKIWNFISNIDWSALGSTIWNAITGIFSSGKGGALGLTDWLLGAIKNSFVAIAQFIANYNLITIIVTLLFGSAAGKQVSDATYNALKGIADAFLWIVGAIGNTIAFFQKIPSMLTWENLGKGLGDALGWIMGALANTINWIVQLPGRIYIAFVNMGNWIIGAWNNTIAFFTTLPGRIYNALAGMGNWIRGAFTNSINWIIGAWNNTVAWFTGLPGRIGSALSGIGSWIMGAFGNTIKYFSDAWKKITDGFNNSSFGAGFARLASAVQPLWDALRKIVCIILGCSPGIVPALQQLYGVFAPIMNAIWSAISPVVNMITGAFQFMISIFQSVGTVVRAAFGQLMSGNIGGAIGTLFSGLSTIGGFVLNALMNIDWMGIFQTIGSSVRGVVSILWSAIFGGDGGNSIFTTLWNTLSSIDWSGILMQIFAQLASLFAQYNPLTLLVTALFGPEAGGQLQMTIFMTLMQIASAFVTGLNVVWGVLTTMASYASIIWNGILAAASFAWGMIQTIIVNPIRAIYSVAVSVFGAIRSFVVGVWNGMKTSAISTFNLIKSAITTPFNTAKSILTSIWNSLKSGWNTTVSTLTSAGNRLKNTIMGPIKTVYNGLVELWNLVTGDHKAKLSGSAGAKGKAGYAGPSVGPRSRPVIGTLSSPTSSTRFGPLAGIGEMVAGFVNRTANVNGLPGRYAGPRPSLSGLGDGPKSKDKCSQDEPCYAGGWDFADNYIAKVKSVLKSWPQKFKINGANIPPGIASLFNNGGAGGMAMFNALASWLVGQTHYQYYYNGVKSDQEVISSHSCNCFDGAELLIHLAQRMGLPASMGHGTWGADGHAWAIIGGQTFDTTAFQHGYGWKSPKVHGYTAGPRPSAGANSKPTKIEINIHGDVYGEKDWTQKMEETADKVFDKKISGESGIGY